MYLEHNLADRLYDIAESKHLFRRIHAGFRKGFLRIVYAIEDGFQKKLMQRCVLALLDFSKAYDTIWREKLLLHMLNMGIQATIIDWIRSFVNNRRARV